MGHALLCSLAGAGAGFLVGFAVIQVAAGGNADAGAVSTLVGIFLGGIGAIAGAIIGGVAELREISKRKDQTPRESPDPDRTKGDKANRDSS